MSGRTAYTYAVLRYCHDIATGEFVNVGVALYAPERGFFAAKFADSLGRVRAAFPAANDISLAKTLGGVAKLLAHLQSSLVADGHKTVSEIVHLAIPKDDSALQWTSASSGIAVNPQATLEQLYRRFVTPESGATSRLDDGDVWRLFAAQFDGTDVLKRLSAKTVSFGGLSVEFQHAWKASYWECLVPISFDLGSADAIQSKAYEWVGRIATVSAGEQFKVTFLVAGPDDAMLEPSFQTALATLKRAPVEIDLYLTSEAEAFAGDLETRMSRAMRRRSGWRL